MDDLKTLRLVWQGDVRTAESLLADAPKTPRTALLKGMASFLLAALSGDKEQAGKAVKSLQECSSVCKAAEAPDTWSGWAASWIISPEPQEATAIRAISELLLAAALGMNNEYLSAPLALRRSLGVVSKLPLEDGPLKPVRLFGSGFFSLLLSLLPRPIVKLLTITGGIDESRLFGNGGPSEKQGEELLALAAANPPLDETTYDHGASYLAMIIHLLFKAGRATPDQLTNSSFLESELAALDTALPDSLVFAWLSGSVLRRLGRHAAASKRMEQVGRRATELQLGLPLYRVTFNRAQCLYATLEYAAAVEVLSPLVSNDSRYTAKAMALMHTAAALCGTGEYTKAREAMRSVGEVATKTKGRLDAQLWQRAQCWLAREDGDLPLCAIELHYSVQYLKGQPADPDLLSRFTVHAAPILAASCSSPQVEPSIVTYFLDGVCYGMPSRPDYNPQKAIECLELCIKTAKEESEYSTKCADRWCGPFALLELSHVQMATGALNEAANSLEASKGIVPQRAYSFHSWHQSMVREGKQKLKELRKASAEKKDGSGGDAAAVVEEEGEEAGEEESAEMAELRVRMEKEAAMEREEERAVAVS